MHELYIQPAGDTGLLVGFGQHIDPAVNDRVLALRAALLETEAMKTGLIVDLVPGYSSLLVLYNPITIAYADVKALLLETVASLVHERFAEGRHISLSVDYDPAHGLDQERLMQHTGLTREELIARHSQVPYKVYMLGFLAGFPYLGGLDPSLHTPRLESPRLRLEEGSVGIAGGQTGVYTVASPGGWNIIGKTQHKLFDPSQPDPFLLEAGDTLTFIASKEPFLKIEGQKKRPIKRGQSLTKDITRPLFRVIQPGLQASIQDYGRFGYLSYGISNAGVMDRDCYRALLALLDDYTSSKEPSLAVLEWVLSGPELESLDRGWIALGGSVNDATLNQQPLVPWRIYAIKAGDRIRLGTTHQSLRAYLAVKGGFATAVDLGSRSFDKQNGLGTGPIEAGSILEVLSNEGATSPLGHRRLSQLPEHLHRVMEVQRLNKALEVRVILGPQEAAFTTKGLETFIGTEWQVSQQLNRMGIRLEGSAIELKGSADIISDGINLGAIQVSGNQQPMIMLNDRQTIGGYAKIANVIEADMSLLAQVSPGMKLKFKSVSISEAHEALRAVYEKPEVYEHEGNLSLESHQYHIRVNGKCYDVLVEPRED